MVKHTQAICRLLPTNCLSVFDYFVGSAFKGLGNTWAFIFIRKAHAQQKRFKKLWIAFFIRRKRFLICVMTDTSEHCWSNCWSISVVVRKYLDIGLNLVKDIFVSMIPITWIFRYQNVYQKSSIQNKCTR